ncbi:MFS transporter [Roseimaritima ulvae]|uniref:Enterobactin exporter EntS n=1 Tax=Roseimaritima ulvae TaxID=980254 RepID=A0A5B9QTN0_9BACT|nr:MFS transporter [Roseimaritima ulvae]QEG41299.1 enterobactin exporter EntS [Roseimaritima ulvae]
MDASARTLLEPFKALRNGVFAKLYFAQTISLLGDAFTWVGLALLSYQFDQARSPTILATALTLRVTAFIIFSPFAGVVADRVERKTILYTTHFIRMGIIGCFPFTTAEWQIYVLTFLLNVFNAFFTPTYQAVIPQVVEKKYYRQAVGLSTATYQLLGILGPAIAGVFALWFGTREIFLIDAATFVIAAVLILMIPGEDLQNGVTKQVRESQNTLADVGTGIQLMFGNRLVRFALSFEFVSAIAGAMILVNTISLIKNEIHLSDAHYGWARAAFGIGAAIAAFVAGAYDKTESRSLSLIGGSLVLGVSILSANSVPLAILIGLWIFAGLGQSLADMPAETLIGENIAPSDQGKVYGAHFAFSHLWWAIAYPIAGYLGTAFPTMDFLIAGIITLSCASLVILFFRPKLDMDLTTASVP